MSLLSSIRPVTRRNALKRASIAALGMSAFASPAWGGMRLFELSSSEIPQPPSKPIHPFYPGSEGAGWKLDPGASDEFDAGLDTSIWDVLDKDDSWGAWDWNSDLVAVKDGRLTLTMRYKHDPARDVYLDSAAIRSKKRYTYGFYEARLKNSSLLPGTCPSFWMKGPTGQPNSSCEVDMIEVTEGNPTKSISQNLHAIVDGKKLHFQNRKLVSDIPHYGDNTANDFHVYAAWITPQTIKLYVDGMQTFEDENTYWHGTMNVLCSLGVRAPFRNPRKEEGASTALPLTSEEAEKAGFPTTALVDWVRVWQK